MAEKEFPKQIFVSWDGNEKENWLDFQESIEDMISNGERIAVYELREIKKLKITKELK